MVNQLNYERMLAAGQPAAMNASCFQCQDLIIRRNLLKDKHLPPPPPRHQRRGHRLPASCHTERSEVSHTGRARRRGGVARVGDGRARQDAFMDSRPVSGHGVTFLRGNDEFLRLPSFPRTRESMNAPPSPPLPLPPFVPFVPFVAIFWSFPTRQTQLMLAKIAFFSIIIEWLE